MWPHFSRQEEVRLWRANGRAGMGGRSGSSAAMGTPWLGAGMLGDPSPSYPEGWGFSSTPINRGQSTTHLSPSPQECSPPPPRTGPQHCLTACLPPSQQSGSSSRCFIRLLQFQVRVGSWNVNTSWEPREQGQRVFVFWGRGDGALRSWSRRISDGFHLPLPAVVASQVSLQGEGSWHQ